MAKTGKTNSKFEQLTKDNAAIGVTVRTDDGKIGKIAKIDKRGNITVDLGEGEGNGLFKTTADKLEADFSVAVRMEDIPESERQPKTTPVRERKDTITRVVGGREYVYKNLGGGHIDNGDEVAVALRGKTLDEVYAHTAAMLKVYEGKLRAAYSANNLGRQRMTLGNLLRSQAKSIAAGLPYVPPFMQAEVKAAAKVERDKKAAEAKAKKEADKAEREAKAQKAKEEREAKAKEAAEKREKEKAEREQRNAEARAKKAADKAKPAAEAGASA